MRGPLDSATLSVSIGPPGVDTPTAAALRAQPGIVEAVVLATCHRTESYVVSSSPPDADISPLYVERGFSLARPVLHLMRVACGLDSPILGDGQVLAQVRRAYLSAREAGATGPYLNRLFEIALQAGKRVRHATDIGRGATTTAAAAVRLAERLARGLEGRDVLIVGAGETAALAARHAAHRRPRCITIANRTRAHAEVVAAKVGGRVAGLDALPEALANADVVIAATSAPEALIQASIVRTAMAARPDRPLVAVDLAVPADIAPDCAEVGGVVLVNLDSVEQSTTADRETRSRAVPEAEAIAVEATHAFIDWCQRRRRRTRQLPGADHPGRDARQPTRALADRTGRDGALASLA